MLLQITCCAENATDLGYLLHKNPASVYRAEHWFGTATVFYPEATPERCTAALLLDVDPVGLVRTKSRVPTLTQYVNDRPYVASSLLCTALTDAFGTAMNGRSKERQERVGELMPLTAHLPAVNCNAGADFITRLFAPLGYAVIAERLPLDPHFPQWGESDVYAVTLSGSQTVQNLLTHLYVLLPVLDNAKHYFVGEDEIEKLLRKGETWLPAHPEKEIITRRYLKYRREMVREALAQMAIPTDDTPVPQDETDDANEAQEEAVEAPIRLNDARLNAALEAVKSLVPPAKMVIDLGCGEGRLLRLLLKERALERITGVDVSSHVLDFAAERLHLERLSDAQRGRIQLLHGSVVYRDERFSGYDVALLIEVIEHLDTPRLTAMEQVVFRHARPHRIVITTPNAEYNAVWTSLPAGKFRHRDHRFEWTRLEFETWARMVAEREGYTVTFEGIGTANETAGTPTQMALFDRL